MSVELLEKIEKCRELVRNRRLGIVFVYVSFVILLVAVCAAMFGVLSFLSEFTIASATKLPSLIAGLIFAGPALALFLVWIWVKPGQSKVQVFADQKSWEADFELRIPKNIASARFLQYSGDQSAKLMSSILERGAKVDLLLKHPSTMELNVQKDKMKLLEQRIGDCFNPDNVEIRFYKQNASVRGISADGEVLGLSWYTYQPRGDVSPEPWLYGHSNLHIAFPCGNGSNSQNVFFNNLFDSLWKNATPMWTKSFGRITKGHGVAGAVSEHYPDGTIKMQTVPFMELGVDISPYHPATLNIDISPRQLVFLKDENTGVPLARTLENVAWTDLHPPETFTFSSCWLTYDGKRYPGLIYYPHPETKERHEQKPGIVEVLCTEIDLIPGREEIELHVNSLEIELK